MARRGQRSVRVPVGDPFDPDGLARALTDHLAYLRSRRFSEHTVTTRRRHLERLVLWLDERGVSRPEEVTPQILATYQRHLSHSHVRGRRPISARTLAGHLVSVKKFFLWVTKTRNLPYNAACDIELPRLPSRIPSAVLTHEEAEVILAVPDTGTLMGVRDRAIFEVLYSTGVRRSELTRIAVADVDLGRDVVFIREGKGKRDRLVPLGDRAAHWVTRYLREVRPHYLGAEDSGVLFLTFDGEPITPNWLSVLVRDVLEESKVDKPGSCHLFRHTMATLMLEGGADIRFIAEMLGHSSLRSTQIYTRVAIDKLRKVHAATHPGAVLPAAEAKEPPRR
jgi:integrase/recombinase XerD